MQNDQKVALTFALYNGQDFVRRQTLSQDIVKIGSGAKANIRLEDADVARMHAVVEAQRTDEVTLIDLGNVTAVNGANVNKCTLKAGDEITVGSTRIVVEAIEHAAASRVASAKPIDAKPFAAAANPFLGAPALETFNPFKQTTASVAEDAPEGSYEYRLMAGTGASPADVESDADGAEIKISWGANLLHVEHVDAKASFYAGETEGKELGCDYFIPAQKLGTARAPFVVDGNVVLLPGANATITVEGKPAMSADEAVAQGLATPCALVQGAHQIALTQGMTVKLQLEDIIVEVRGTKKARKLAGAFTMAAIASGAMLYVLGSLLGHAGMLAAMFSFSPPLGDTVDDEMTDEQRYLVQQYLDSAAEDQKKPADDAILEETANNDPTQGGTGQRAKGEEGKMGSEIAKTTDGRWAVKGNNPQPYVSKREAMREAASFGMIGLLSSDMGSMNEPTAAFGADVSDGADPLSANGNMWGSEIGSAFGPGGLGLTGVGDGAGGFGEGIGLGEIGTIGHGAGAGCPGCQGFGDGWGTSNSFLRRGHKAKAPNAMRQGQTTMSGRLPPEVIQRIVRANFGRYRACYQGALKTNPNLQGRVVVNFVIGRSGTVGSVSGGGDLPNQGVIGCVASAFQSLTFPQPEGGIVTVSYPLVFSPTN